MKILYFYFIFVIIFALLDPDPHIEFGSGSTNLQTATGEAFSFSFFPQKKLTAFTENHTATGNSKFVIYYVYLWLGFLVPESESAFPRYGFRR
jgi:hypothetical protein